MSQSSSKDQLSFKEQIEAAAHRMEFRVSAETHPELKKPKRDLGLGPWAPKEHPGCKAPTGPTGPAEPRPTFSQLFEEYQIDPKQLELGSPEVYQNYRDFIAQPFEPSHFMKFI